MPSVKAARSRHRGPQVGHQAAQLAGRRRARGSGRSRAATPSIVAGVSRTPGRISRAKARVEGNALFSWSKAGIGRLQHARQGAQRAAHAGLLVGQRRRGGVEVGDEPLEVAPRCATARRPPCPEERMSVARSRGSVPRKAWLTSADWRSAAGEWPSASCSAWPPVLPAHLGVLGGVLLRRGGAVERVAVALHQLLEVAPRVRLQRAQHLVELHGRRGLARADRAPVRQVGRAGRARAQVHEEVALQEDPRADLQLGVAVDRQPVLVDLHRHLRERGVAARRTRPWRPCPRSRPRSGPAS